MNPRPVVQGAAETPLTKRWLLLRDLLNEQQRRRWAAIEADSIGDGGIQTVVRATGMARQTIQRGLEELNVHRDEGSLGPWFLDPTLAQREEGGGRKSRAGDLLSALATRMNQQAAGKNSREVVFRWTCSSLRELAKGPPAVASHTHVALLLAQAGYDIVTEPWRARSQHAEYVPRQYSSVASAVTTALDAGQPVVVLSLSKARRRDDLLCRRERDEMRRVARADRALATTIWGRDCWDEGVLGETLARQGWSSSAPDVQTVMLAAQAVRQWWDAGRQRKHGGCGEVLIIANALGLDSELEARWRLELSRFAVEAGVGVRSCYLPGGICKWTHIASRLGAVLAIDDEGDFVGRHKVTCRVIGSASRHSHPETRRGRRGARPVAIDAGQAWPRFEIRYNKKDEPLPMKNWDYSLSIIK